jgi:hypothetical protein
VKKECDSKWCSDWKTWNRGLISAEERNSSLIQSVQTGTLLFKEYVGNYFSGGKAAGA